MSQYEIARLDEDGVITAVETVPEADHRTDPVASAASATAGASGALPGAPVGWVDVLINGTVRRTPYWGT